MRHIETVRRNDNGREESVHDYRECDDEHDLVAQPWDFIERNELRDRIKYREDLMKAERYRAED